MKLYVPEAAPQNDSITPNKAGCSAVRALTFLPQYPAGDVAPLVILLSEPLPETELRHLGQLASQTFRATIVISGAIETTPTSDVAEFTEPQDPDLDAREFLQDDTKNHLLLHPELQKQLSSGDYNVIAIDETACLAATEFLENNPRGANEVQLYNPDVDTVSLNSSFFQNLIAKYGVKVSGIFEGHIPEEEIAEINLTIPTTIFPKQEDQNGDLANTEDLILHSYSTMNLAEQTEQSPRPLAASPTVSSIETPRATTSQAATNNSELRQSLKSVKEEIGKIGTLSTVRLALNKLLNFF